MRTLPERWTAPSTLRMPATIRMPLRPQLSSRSTAKLAPTPYTTICDTASRSLELQTPRRMIHAAPGLFLRYEPLGEAVPLVIDVSRSGREYPKEYRSPLPFTTVHDNVSMYVEDLWAGAPAAGATLLYCCFPNTWIDVNRSELDMDPAIVDGPWPVKLEPTARTLEGLGLIKTKARYGEPFQERKLTVAEIEERRDRYYRPYLAELARIAAAMHARFGRLLQISCHCMSAVGAPTHPDAGKPRADFCVSDLKGKTASKPALNLVVDALRNYGYTVSINDPYVGN